MNSLPNAEESWYRKSVKSANKAAGKKEKGLCEMSTIDIANTNQPPTNRETESEICWCKRVLSVQSNERLSLRQIEKYWFMRSYLTHLTTRTIFLGIKLKYKNCLKLTHSWDFFLIIIKRDKQAIIAREKSLPKKRTPGWNPFIKKIMLKILYNSGGLLAT